MQSKVALIAQNNAIPEAAHQAGIHVVLAAEQLGTLWGIPVTNTLITSWVVVALLVLLAWLVGRNPKLVPGRVQILLEEIITYIQNFVRDTLENESVARRYMPLFITLFLFIAGSNLLEFTPGIGSLGFTRAGEFVPLFRSVNTDLNVTLALAIMVVIIIEFAGIISLGFFRYAGKFITFRGHGIGNRIINCVVGIIELISEISRLVSFSFRLFGNIFAGEVLLAVATFFAPYILPVPLMGFEMFVGFVQAAVFALLTLFFIKLAITDPHVEH
jgi:F-type H+-transporting ATPase subunit a